MRILILLSLLSFQSFANGIDAQVFKFSNSFDTLVIEDALRSDRGVNLEKPWFLKFSGNYANDPLITIDAERESQINKNIQSFTSLDFGGAYLFTDKILMGVSGQIHKVNDGVDKTTDVGDTQVFLKYRLREKNDHAWALMPYIVIPTGEADKFVSDDSTGFGMRLIFEKNFEDLDIYSNLGFFWANNAIVQNIDLRKRVTAGIGLLYHFNDTWAYNLEWKGEFGTPFAKDQNPAEIYTGIRARALDWLNTFAGIGLGNIDITGAEGSSNTHSNDIRVFAGLKFRFSSPTPKGIKEEIKKALVILRGVEFEFNKDILTKDSVKILDNVVKIIKKNRRYFRSIEIQGHTDSIGNDEFNMDLSKRRVKAVYRFLVKRGLPSKLFTARGFGETRPKVKERNDKDRQTNRRVEFKVDYY